MAKPQRKQAQVLTKSIPAPIGGLNARDAIAEMGETDALLLDNCFCTPSTVNIRNGYVNWKTGLPGWVETIAHYNGATTKKLFAASVAGIYDVTSQGAVGGAVVSGLTNTRFQTVNFANAGSNWLYMVNGADDPRLYNGSTWQAVNAGSSPIAISGVTTANLISVNVYKSRLWFVENNTTKVWYLPVNAVGGAAQSIDFGPLFKLGGFLMAMLTWTIDTGNGMNEFAVFVSSEGEVLVYTGYDPTVAATFYLVGTFRIGRPIGRRFYCKYGSDIIMITADGVIPLSQALLTDRTSEKIALSDKIVNLISTDVQNYASHFGWQPILYPIGNKIIINVPQTENSRQYQYVMNTISQAWSSFGKVFSPWNAACFEFFNDALYFGGNTVVASCDTGAADNNGSIMTDIQQAFNYFGARGENKYWTMGRPLFVTNGNMNISIGLNIDYSTDIPVSSPNVSVSATAPWDTSAWDVTAWANDGQVVRDWQTLGGIGFAASFRMRTQTQGITASWQATDFVYQMGGIL